MTSGTPRRVGRRCDRELRIAGHRGRADGHAVDREHAIHDDALLGRKGGAEERGGETPGRHEGFGLGADAPAQRGVDLLEEVRAGVPATAERTRSAASRRASARVSVSITPHGDRAGGPAARWREAPGRARRRACPCHTRRSDHPRRS